jgi:hypothetical protein
MNSEEFVKTINTVAVENVKKSIVELLNNPPGRKPKEKLKALSTYFNKFNDGDKKIIEEIIELSAMLSTFNFLSVIDGVISIDSSEENGTLELRYRKNTESILLNEPEGEFLHDLLPKVI